jgi:hypothetical protein
VPAVCRWLTHNNPDHQNGKLQANIAVAASCSEFASLCRQHALYQRPVGPGRASFTTLAPEQCDEFGPATPHVAAGRGLPVHSAL